MERNMLFRFCKSCLQWMYWLPDHAGVNQTVLQHHMVQIVVFFDIFWKMAKEEINDRRKKRQEINDRRKKNGGKKHYKCVDWILHHILGFRKKCLT